MNRRSEMSARTRSQSVIPFLGSYGVALRDRANSSASAKTQTTFGAVVGMDADGRTWQRWSYFQSWRTLASDPTTSFVDQCWRRRSAISPAHREARNMWPVRKSWCGIGDAGNRMRRNCWIMRLDRFKAHRVRQIEQVLRNTLRALPN